MGRIATIATGTVVVAVLGFQQLEIQAIHEETQDIKEAVAYLIHTRERIQWSNTDLKCLAENIFYEAGVEPVEGKYAVAQVTLNRLRTGRWGKTICAVVHSPSQFSWTKIKDRKSPAGPLWAQSQQVARNVLMGGIRVKPLESALMYHADYVKPKWRDPNQYITKVGQHIFYRRALGSTIEL